MVADPTEELRYQTGRGRWVIAATVLGSGMASLDGTVVGIALPTIGKQFHAGISTLQWVVTGYTLTLAGLLLLGGTLGDRLGRQRVFIVGTVWFALASLVCGLAPNAPLLIAARALQGIGAALLTPGSLAILQASFVENDRGRAIGAWSGLGGIATAIGPFLGGWLISAVSWRLIFFINLPVAVLVVLVSVRHVPDSKDPTVSGRLDVGGAGLVTAGLVSLVYGLIEGAELGWTSPAIVITLVLGAGLLVAFWILEGRLAHPMLPPDALGSRQFTAANVVTFVVYGGLGGALFLLPVDLQQVARYSPIAAGAALLPVTAMMFLLSARSGALAARIGPRLQMSVGPVLVGAGLVLMVRVTGAGSYVGEVLPAALVLGFGLAITVAPLTATVLAAAPEEHTGIASAINNDVARTASLIAVAVLPVAAGITGAAYLHPSSLSHGFHVAVLIAGAACALGGLLAAVVIRNPAAVSPLRPELALQHDLHCCLDGPPLRQEAAVTGPGPAA